ncbi:MAG TPA: hypothetical protein DCY03_02580 [Planctomycetaceae bacterium]|nr:hypothetical protein [Planctomycetaceae bacterium]|tara:strand:- start:10567 stop:11583 length:1017 start_codon:yes stop_codon:yes gene_type:complete
MTDKVVLIADDDHELSQALAIRLRGLGYTVMRSPDASHALIGAMRIKPNLIILDVDMPSGNGLAVCEMLNGDESCHGIPVIIHTGHTDTETIQRCKQLAAVYIQKCPGSPATITEIAREFLQLDIQPVVEPVEEAQKTPETRDLSLSYIKSIGKAEYELSEADGTPIDPASEQNVTDQTQEADSDSPDSHEKRPPIVLSIDDDRDISKALQMKLKPHGVECLSAFTGDQGYEMAVEHMPDVIITDLVLPEAEGIYIMRRIRSNPLLSEIPIIVLTGQSYPAIKHQILSLGVEAFLTKPVSINELIKELQSVIPIKYTLTQDTATISFNKNDNKIASMA